MNIVMLKSHGHMLLVGAADVLFSSTEAPGVNGPFWHTPFDGGGQAVRPQDIVVLVGRVVDQGIDQDGIPEAIVLHWKRGLAPYAGGTGETIRFYKGELTERVTEVFFVTQPWLEWQEVSDEGSYDATLARKALGVIRELFGQEMDFFLLEAENFLTFS